MNKLSEIGREMWIEEIYIKDKRDTYEIAHSAGVLLDEDNIRAAAVRVHVYDDNERRELVRRVFEAAREGCAPSDVFEPDYWGADCLIKEQGL